MSVQSRTRGFEWFGRRSTENLLRSKNKWKNFSGRLLANKLKNTIAAKDTIHYILTKDINELKVYARFVSYALTDKQ